MIGAEAGVILPPPKGTAESPAATPAGERGNHWADVEPSSWGESGPDDP